MTGDDFARHTVNGSGVQEVELQAMAEADRDAAANAPLIHHDSQDESTAQSNSAAQASANLFIWALTISAGVSGLLFGYDTGVISSTLVSIGSDLSSRELTTLDKSLITSSTSLFALIASPIAGVLADRVGRKNVIFLADALFTFGALWQAITTTVWGMILGRSIVGMAIGAASLIVPLYISELAPSNLRGRLVTVSLLFVTGGQVVAYIIGWAFSNSFGGWRWMVGLGSIPAITQLFLLAFMPETPRYLLAQGHREEQARNVLRKVYKSPSGDDEEVIESIVRAVKSEMREEEEARVLAKSKETGSSWMPPLLRSLLQHPPHARALTIACLLQALQQLCGFNSLMYFSATIFSLLRFSSPTLTSLSIAITNFLFTIAAFFLIDRIGRRRILLMTIPVLVVALLLCALAFTFVTLPHYRGIDGVTDPTLTSTASSRLPALAILFSLILYVCSYATGLGPVPWQQSELFPLSVRSLGSSIATATNWGCNTLVGLTFLPMMELLTPGWTFVCYAVICAVGWVAVWWIYPETMNLGLEEVGDLLRDGWGVEASLAKAAAAKQDRHSDER